MIGFFDSLSEESVEENGEDDEVTQIEVRNICFSKLGMFEEIILCNIFCLYACVD